MAAERGGGAAPEREVEEMRGKLEEFLSDCQAEVMALQAERDTAAVAAALARPRAVGASMRTHTGASAATHAGGTSRDTEDASAPPKHQAALPVEIAPRDSDDHDDEGESKAMPEIVAADRAADETPVVHVSPAAPPRASAPLSSPAPVPVPLPASDRARADAEVAARVAAAVHAERRRGEEASKAAVAAAAAAAATAAAAEARALLQAAAAQSAGSDARDRPGLPPRATSEVRTSAPENKSVQSCSDASCSSQDGGSKSDGGRETSGGEGNYGGEGGERDGSDGGGEPQHQSEEATGAALRELSSQARLLRAALKAAETDKTRREETIAGLSKIVRAQQEAIARATAEREAAAALERTVGALRTKVKESAAHALAARAEADAAREAGGQWKAHCLAAHEDLAAARARAAADATAAADALRAAREDCETLAARLASVEAEHALAVQRASDESRARDAIFESNGAALEASRAKLAEGARELASARERAREDASAAERRLRAEVERGRSLKAELARADESSAALREQLRERDSAAAVAEARADELSDQLARRDEALAYVEGEISRLTDVFKDTQSRLTAERDAALTSAEEAAAERAAAVRAADDARTRAEAAETAAEARAAAAEEAATAECDAARAQAEASRMRAVDAERELVGMLQAMERQKAALLELACDRLPSGVGARRADEPPRER